MLSHLFRVADEELINECLGAKALHNNSTQLEKPMHDGQQMFLCRNWLNTASYLVNSERKF